MQHFSTGDLVLLVNSTYNPELIGHIGIVVHSENQFTGHDKYNRLISGVFVIVDLPHDINRFENSLWYLKPEHLVKIYPEGNAGKEEMILNRNFEFKSVSEL